MPGPKVLTPLPIPELAKRRIGRIFEKMRKMSREDTDAAQRMRETTHKDKRFGAICIEMGKVTELDVEIALAAKAGYEFVDLEGWEPDPAVLTAFQPATANAYKVVPVEYDAQARTVKIVMRERGNLRAADDLKNVLNFRQVTCVIAQPAQVDSLLVKHYGATAPGGQGPAAAVSGAKRILAEEASPALKAHLPAPVSTRIVPPSCFARSGAGAAAGFAFALSV